MLQPIHFSGESESNRLRDMTARVEPPALRTYTPTQAVLARSQGVYHWTPEGRRLYDYTSGVLVANLGHNPRRWLERFWGYMGWGERGLGFGVEGSAVPLTAYNAITPVEAEASRRLLANLQARPGGVRLEQVMWAASGSEAIQKALWACLHRAPERDIVVATRHGFHGKKGLAGACTGDETSPERDPRVRFVSFPMDEVRDVTMLARPLAGGSQVHAGPHSLPVDAVAHPVTLTRSPPGETDFDLGKYERELDGLREEYGSRLCCLITEPYLGGSGSYHPPAEYLQLLERFCREMEIPFILDEVQSNFGRTGPMYAFEKYGVEPDIVALGKGLGNGAPVSAAVGRRELLASLKYGEASDTYSGNPLSCAAVLATLDEFETTDVLQRARAASEVLRAGLLALKDVPFVQHVRGEGMVWGVEVKSHGGRTAEEVAIECVRACYLGDEQGRAIHLLGPLAGKVLRISPPLVITVEELQDSLEAMQAIFEKIARQGA